ncbi:MAG TPA: DUF4845 domain-containing protein [Steroidobacteraceae bacterium]|jgi:hypothetical protein
MRSRQRGITFIGWLFLLTPLAILGYTGVRLTPVYLNYMKVVRSLDAVATEFRDGGVNPGQLKGSLEKHFEIESIDYPDVKDVKIDRDGKQWVVTAAFDDQAPLFANISIQVAFDKSVRIGTAGAD